MFWSQVGAALLKNMGLWPQWMRHGFAELVLKVAYPFVKKRRRVARINLQNCFPDWTADEVEQTVRTHFKYFCHALFDRSLFWFGDLAAFDKNIVLQDESHLHGALATGRPIVVLAPHFIGLDIGGLRMSFEREMCGMYQVQNNPVFEELIREGRARGKRTHLFTRQDGIRGLVKMLRKNVMMYYLPDMDFGRRESIFVPFFNIQTATLDALPKIARLTNALIVPCVTRIDADALKRGQTLYTAQFYPAWDNGLVDEVQAVVEMNRFIEARILEEPAQYLWMHKRFKTRPEGELSFYRAEIK